MARKRKTSSGTKNDSWGNLALPDWNVNLPKWGAKTVVADRRDSEELVEESKKKGTYKQILDPARARQITHYETNFLRITNIEQLITLPLPNQQWRIVTQQHFNTFTFILYILKHRGNIDSLDIITFNINQPTISNLLDLFDSGKIKQLSITISDSVKFRMPERVTQLREAFKSRRHTGRFFVSFVWNHAKIALIAIDKDRYVIEGSGNFSSNAEIEQYVFENNRYSYIFHRRWLNVALFGDRGGKRRELLQ